MRMLVGNSTSALFWLVGCATGGSSNYQLTVESYQSVVDRLDPKPAVPKGGICILIIQGIRLSSLLTQLLCLSPLVFYSSPTHLGSRYSGHWIFSYDLTITSHTGNTKSYSVARESPFFNHGTWQVQLASLQEIIHVRPHDGMALKFDNAVVFDLVSRV
jgi:hypothetical protein